MELKISKEFSDALGGRFYTDGKFSGQEFYEKLLERKYIEAVNKGEQLVINLDGTYGYPSSFIDQSFGELSRVYGKDKVLEKLEFISNDQPGLIDIIKKNIENPNQ